MVFEEFNNNNSELNKSRTGEILDNPLSLLQGNIYKKKINNKKGDLQFDNNFPGLIEGMTVKRKLDEINEKEKAWLKKNEGKVKTAMSKYSTEYESMMREHLRLSRGIPQCKGDCMTTYPTTVPDFQKKRKACMAGCDLKGPYVLKCKNSYEGSLKDPSKRCEHLTAGKCDSGTIIMGNEEFIQSQDNRDINGLTLQQGCCECGGGGGGKPTTRVSGNKIKSCEDPQLKVALGGFDGKAFCVAAPYPYPSQASKLHLKYDKVLKKNKALENEALKIWNNIAKLDSIDDKVKQNTVDEEERIARNLSKFQIARDKIQNMGLSANDDIGGERTIDAQLEESRLLEPSEKWHLAAWSLLGVLLIGVTVDLLNKKVDL